MSNGHQKNIGDKYSPGCIRCYGYRRRIDKLQDEITNRGEEIHKLKKKIRELRKQLREAKK